MHRLHLFLVRLQYAILEGEGAAAVLPTAKFSPDGPLPRGHLFSPLLTRSSPPLPRPLRPGEEAVVRQGLGFPGAFRATGLTDDRKIIYRLPRPLGTRRSCQAC